MGEFIRSFNEHKYLHFDNEAHIRMSSKNDEGNGHNLDLDCSNLVLHILGEVG
jgi:hypothetical protein